MYLFGDDYFVSILDKELEAQIGEIICQELHKNINCEKKALGMALGRNVFSYPLPVNPEVAELEEYWVMSQKAWLPVSTLHQPVRRGAGLLLHVGTSVRKVRMWAWSPKVSLAFRCCFPEGRSLASDPTLGFVLFARPQGAASLFFPKDITCITPQSPITQWPVSAARSFCTGGWAQAVCGNQDRSWNSARRCNFCDQLVAYSKSLLDPPKNGVFCLWSMRI